MKYEIIKDNEDMYVLIVDSVLVLIHRDLTEITYEIHKREGKLYEESPIETVQDTSSRKVADGSLGKLFDI